MVIKFALSSWLKSEESTHILSCLLPKLPLLVESLLLWSLVIILFFDFPRLSSCKLVMKSALAEVTLPRLFDPFATPLPRLTSFADLPFFTLLASLWKLTFTSTFTLGLASLFLNLPAVFLSHCIILSEALSSFFLLFSKRDVSLGSTILGSGQENAFRSLPLATVRISRIASRFFSFALWLIPHDLARRVLSPFLWYIALLSNYNEKSKLIIKFSMKTVLSASQIA